MSLNNFDDYEITDFLFENLDKILKNENELIDDPQFDNIIPNIFDLNQENYEFDALSILQDIDVLFKHYTILNKILNSFLRGKKKFKSKDYCNEYFCIRQQQLFYMLKEYNSILNNGLLDSMKFESYKNFADKYKNYISKFCSIGIKKTNKKIMNLMNESLKNIKN